MTLTKTIHVRCHELSPLIGDVPANLALIESAIKDAVDAEVQLLVLPELATSGYYLDQDEARSCALAASDPVFERWTDLLLPSMTVVVGFCENFNGVIYNSAAVLTSAGMIAVYRKTHLWDNEQNVFSTGNEAPLIIETPIGVLGVLICYDLEFPEMPRLLAIKGAEIIAIPTNWPTVPHPSGEHPPEVVQAMAAARSSCVAIACCDRGGEERGYTWTQGTTVVGPDGWLTGEKDAEGRLNAVVTIAENRTRIGTMNDVLQDRRPALYSQWTTA